MRKTLIVASAALACLAASSCGHIHPKPLDLMSAQCMIETEAPDTLVEATLDGKLIFSGKTRQEKSGNLERCDFTAPPGDHRLVIHAAGYDTWERRITLIGGSNRFWAHLEKQR